MLTPPFLTYREAAKRVHRSVLTIKRWRRRGLLAMGWDVRGGQRVRVVREDILLACWRDRMKADPIRQRMRHARNPEKLTTLR